MSKYIQFVLLVYFCCSCSQKNGYEYVDLGLPSGNLWATCNIGAEKPTDSGCYFAWGETKSKKIYNWHSYSLSIGDSVMKRYNLNRRSQYADGKIFLSTIDDPAVCNIGKSWETPSLNDFVELQNGCQWKEISNFKNSGIAGFIGTSKYNGNQIFFPKSKIMGLDNKIHRGPIFWTSELDKDFEDVSSNYGKFKVRLKLNYCTAMTSGGFGLPRCYGMSIRAIKRREKKQNLRDSSIYNLYFLKYDKIEDSQKYKNIIAIIEQEVEDSLNRVPNIASHTDIFLEYIDIKRFFLKKNGIEWKSPLDENPELFKFCYGNSDTD